MCNIFNFDTEDQISSVCTHPQHPHLHIQQEVMNVESSTYQFVHYCPLLNMQIIYVTLICVYHKLLQSLCVQIDVKTAHFVSN